MAYPLLTKILGDPNVREVKRARTLVDKVNAFEDKIAALSDAELSGQTAKFKERLAAGEKLDELLPECRAIALAVHE